MKIELTELERKCIRSAIITEKKRLNGIKGELVGMEVEKYWKVGAALNSIFLKLDKELD